MTMSTPDRSAESPPHSSNGAWLAVALLLSVNLFNYIDRQVLAAVVPAIQKDFPGASDAQVGLLFSAFLVSYMLAAPVFGWLADRYSRWKLVGVGVILWSLASGASGLAGVYPLADVRLPDWLPAVGGQVLVGGVLSILIARLFVGVGEAAYGPAAPTILSDLFPVEKRGQIISWFYVAIPVGSALGYLLGGMVLNAGLSWHWAFYLTVPPGILLGVVPFFLSDPPKSDAGGGDDHRLGGWEEYKVILRTPSFLLNTAAMTALTFAMGGIGAWMPKYVEYHTDGAISSATASSIFGPVLVVSGLAATLAGGWAGDWLRTRVRGSYFVVSAVAMLIGFPLLLAVTVTPFPAAWGLVALAVFCLFFNTGPSNTALANVTHPSMRAAAFALNILIIHALGDVVSPPLIGLANDLSGGNQHVGIRVVSISILIGGVLWLWAAKHLDEDTARAEGRAGPPATPAAPH
jgi:MFS family permease